MGELLSGSKRVKGIFSVIASANRLEIVKILNAKGALSYSELKSLAGFKSKKESGKFAYHLRKLVKQGLVTLNRAERKYIITSLGRLILNLSRQIEEHAVLESGKLYVRTSKHKIEEFNTNKITQSLVKEGGMPLDLAQKVTAEVENKIYKFQTTYLTAPLIREIVNAVLIEQGFEEYRHKLTRLGLPVHDVIELISKVGLSGEGVEVLMSQTAQAVFSEFLLLNQLTKDVADLYLAGDTHISNPGRWGIAPDTVVADAACLQTSSINPSMRMLAAPRLTSPTNFSEALSIHSAATILLASECNTELCWLRFGEYVARAAKDISDKQLMEDLYREFVLIGTVLGQRGAKPRVSLHIGECELTDSDRTNNILGGYRRYVEATPLPTINIVLHGSIGDDTLNEIYKLVMVGGSLAFCPSKQDTNSYLGLRLSAAAQEISTLSMLLHGFSINLPRLARESQEDEMYFRAKMTILLKDALAALQTRRGIILEQVRKGVLPIIENNIQTAALEEIPTILNLAGLLEASQILLKDKRNQSALMSIAEKTIETAVKGTNTEEETAVSIVPEEGLARLAALDIERYGKTATISSLEEGYSASLELDADKLDEEKLKLAEIYSRKLTGGCSISVRINPNMNIDGLKELLNTLSTRFTFFKIGLDISICRNCGAKNASTASRCNVCKSTRLARMQIL
ncbi:MAG: anaerobic ribonucleoside-triphosphate reductase [Nitrososphaerales archaeon]